ncbi:hypothetical protein EV702DRAFT_1047671 [Suillus placidus]|uniref:Uncharacterized protein n=1 Tax=Suillus placidus TaxID=48579 RepID=A0A9P6ZQL8_9AGAM|nr:hypothetical protein EV702DRAFT_1047671 [Suillus placidus]
MPSASFHDLEQDLKALQISKSKDESKSEQRVPAKRKKGIPQFALVRPLPAANGHRQLFGFPITLDDLKHLATIAFNHLRPGETLDTPTFMFFNFPTFIQQSLRLPICTVARGQVDGPSENIPSECMATPTTVQLLVVWKDTDSDDYCPTQRQLGWLCVSFCVSSMTGHDPKKRFQRHSSHPYKAILTLIRQCQGI